jgi:hypothetical protein
MMAGEPGLSFAQAYAKVYVDPANAEIAKRERAESAPPLIAMAEREMQAETFVHP